MEEARGGSHSCWQGTSEPMRRPPHSDTMTHKGTKKSTVDSVSQERLCVWITREICGADLCTKPMQILIQRAWKPTEIAGRHSTGVQRNTHASITPRTQRRPVRFSVAARAGRPSQHQLSKCDARYEVELQAVKGYSTASRGQGPRWSTSRAACNVVVVVVVERTYSVPPHSQHGRDAVLDGKALARLGADQVAVDDLDLEQHVVQRLEEALVLAKVGGNGRRQRLLHAKLRRESSDAIRAATR